jgi:hypothetical protein
MDEQAVNPPDGGGEGAGNEGKTEICAVVLIPNELGNAWVPHQVSDFVYDTQQGQSDTIAITTAQALHFSTRQYLVIIEPLIASRGNLEFQVYKDMQNLLNGNATARVLIATRENFELMKVESENASKVIVPADATRRIIVPEGFTH